MLNQLTEFIIALRDLLEIMEKLNPWLIGALSLGAFSLVMIAKN